MADTATETMSEKLARVLAEEVFIRSQGWSEWPTLEEIQRDAPGIVAAMGEATGWGGFDAWNEGTKSVTVALLDEMEKNGTLDSTEHVGSPEVPSED